MGSSLEDLAYFNDDTVTASHGACSKLHPSGWTSDIASSEWVVVDSSSGDSTHQWLMYDEVTAISGDIKVVPQIRIANVSLRR